MKKQTLIRKLKKAGVCSDGMSWLKKQKETDIKKIAFKAIKENHFGWVNWALPRIMNYKQRVSYAVYAAKQVLPNFEDENPHDKNPREAIEAAIRCIKNPSKKNKDAARSSARSAARSACSVASTYSATDSAYSAVHSADSAHSAYSANSAYSAADSAAHSVVAFEKMEIKIIKYGLKLLKGERENEVF